MAPPTAAVIELRSLQRHAKASSVTDKLRTDGHVCERRLQPRQISVVCDDGGGVVGVLRWHSRHVGQVHSRHASSDIDVENIPVKVVRRGGYDDY